MFRKRWGSYTSPECTPSSPNCTGGHWTRPTCWCQIPSCPARPCLEHLLYRQTEPLLCPRQHHHVHPVEAGYSGRAPRKSFYCCGLASSPESPHVLEPERHFRRWTIEASFALRGSCAAVSAPNVASTGTTEPTTTYPALNTNVPWPSVTYGARHALCCRQLPSTPPIDLSSTASTTLPITPR